MTPEDNLIQITTHKEITHLYKSFLEMLEDIEKNNEIMLKKVGEKVSTEFASNINYFTKEYYEQLRKRVLDAGNDTNRQLLAFLEFFDFIINKQKVEDAASKRVIKKFVTSMPVTLK